MLSAIADGRRLCGTQGGSVHRAEEAVGRVQLTGVVSSADHGPMVKRLRHHPFTVESRVRFPVGSPKAALIEGGFYVKSVALYK